MERNKLNKKTYFNLAVLLLMCTFLLKVNAQDKPVAPSVTKYSTSSSTNDLNAVTSVKPHEEVVNPEKQELLNQLRSARESNNVQMKEQIENRLNQINGTSPVQFVPNNSVIGGSVSDVQPPFNNSTDFMTTPVLPYGAGVWSLATQTVAVGAPNAGRIWAGITIYGGAAAADTARFYYSDNGGVSWTSSYTFYFSGLAHFRGSELDLELAYDGTTLYLYGVCGFTDVSSRTQSLFFRFNTTTAAFFAATLTWPGNATTTNLYYNPRITTDNSNYTNLSYIYMSCSFDSTYGASLHYARQKYAIITSPFAVSPTINYAQPGPANNGGFYWNSSGQSTTGYLYTDIGYTRSTGNVDRVFTVFNVPNTLNYNLYLSFSDDYGATVPAANASFITEANVDYGAKISFNAGTNKSGMIAYVRQFSGTDWDPYYRGSTADGGATWTTSGYIDASGNRTRRVDLAAPRNATNVYKVAYTQDSTGGQYGYYTGGTPGTWNQPNPLAVTNNGVDTSFGKIVAGFKNGGGDDCFSVYALLSGGQIYASRLCQTTVGIHNENEAPKTYSLSQNYPNPFNPTTNIKFSIPKNSAVKLSIYDLTGKVIATLVDGQLNAGNYAYDFDASNIATGVYFYKLESDGFTDVKKMMLIK